MIDARFRHTTKVSWTITPSSLVVLDIWMEQMNGLEVQEQLRALSPSTRVIIITGRVDHAATHAALDAGAIAFFIKPFDGEEFLAAVRSALSSSHSK